MKYRIKEQIHNSSGITWYWPEERGLFFWHQIYVDGEIMGDPKIELVRKQLAYYVDTKGKKGSGQPWETVKIHPYP